MVESAVGTYHFKASPPEGGVFTGQMQAGSEAEALRRLRSAGYIPIRLQEHPIRTSILDREIGFGTRRKLRVQDCESLCRELSIMLGAGVELIEAMSILGPPSSKSSPLRSFCAEVRQWLRMGSSFSVAVANSGFSCPADLVPVLKAGEDSGALVTALEMLAGSYRESAKFSRMLVGALTYPAFLLATAIAVVLIIAFLVAPNLVGLFAAMEKPVPPVIAALDTMRAFAIGNGGLLGIAAVAAVLVLGTLINLPSFRGAVRSVAFAIPVIGSVLTWSASRRFAETLKLYVASNVPLATALPSALVAAGFPEGARRAEQLAADLRGGLKLSTAVAELKLLPEQVVHLLRVGEGNGKLVDVLGAAADEASVRLERQSTLLSALLAPILIVVVGVVIGSIIFTVFSALLDINDIAA